MTSSQDPYCYPGTHVLKNRGHYQTCDDLNAFEVEAITLAFLDWSKIVHQEDGRKKFYLARDMAIIQGDTKLLTSLIEMSLSSV